MIKTIFGGAAALTLVLGLSGPGISHEHGHKPVQKAMHSASATAIKVEKAWARATPGMVRNGGAYLTIVNAGKFADRLVGASSDVARRTEVHTHLKEDGVMKMRKVDGVDLGAGEMIVFRPGGYHVMLMGLDKPLKEGEKFPIMLEFEKAGNITVEVEVMAVGAMGSGHGAHGGMNEGKKEEMKNGMGGHAR